MGYEEEGKIIYQTILVNSDNSGLPAAKYEKGESILAVVVLK